jgi:UDP-N-acetylglucosamine/UDP-N-acetylgalactosamine 4-epimerase
MQETLKILKDRMQGKSHRWLVTGAAGFIGSNLVEALLLLGQKVKGLDNFATGKRENLRELEVLCGEHWKNFEFIEGDIRDEATCARACDGVDYVLHQAALGSVPRSINDPATSNAVNVSGTLNMLTAAKEAGVKRFVYASSSSVYGDEPNLPKVEERIGNSLSPYAVTKRVNEMYALVFSNLHGLETVGLRYFNVFGPRQDPEGEYAAVIPKWIDTLINGKACKVNGDGETSRDFCFVDNVVQANIMAALSPVSSRFGVYNIACGEQTTLNQLHDALSSTLRRLKPDLALKSAEYGPERPGDVRHSLASIERAEKELGYDPQVRAKQGLERVTEWFVKARYS